jgi:hypothetical protein
MSCRLGVIVILMAAGVTAAWQRGRVFAPVHRSGRTALVRSKSLVPDPCCGSSSDHNQCNGIRRDCGMGSCVTCRKRPAWRDGFRWSCARALAAQ